MSEHSAIEWTDATWNPTTGCTKVSPACANCYIERTMPFRTQGRKFVKGHIQLELHENRLTQPSQWKTPKLVFVNSLSDLFHDDVPVEFIGRVFNVMGSTPRHTYQVLTKRPTWMQRVVTAYYETLRIEPYQNVWLGVSVENQHFADERIPLLLQTPAAVRFISAEPLLGPIDFHSPVLEADCDGYLDWVIVGGESGPRLRPTEPAWVRSLRDQCVAARVPFFFKQWGGKTPKSGGRLLDGRTWDEYPGVESHPGLFPDQAEAV